MIEGVLESPNENIREKVTAFFESKLSLTDASSIMLSRVHRIGVPPHLKTYPSDRPRPIIVRFQNYMDRDRVFRASWNLREKHLFVREDYTEAMKTRRNKLLPVLRAAKRDPSVKKCTLRADNLIIDGKRYTVHDFDNIPEHLRWTVKGERYFSACNTTFFFGKDCYLSNHHASPFLDNGTRYLCVEQFYLRHKALFFEDTATTAKIMKETDPGKMKRLSHNLKKVDEEKWKPQACWFKFLQNQKLKKQLIESQGSLVEANGRDNFFSCGLALSNPNILDRNKWQGENVLGQTLTSLRETLKNQN